jgi:hypothetical protein
MTHPWIEHNEWFGNIDWLWMAPRALARAAFSIERASCDWLRCVQGKVVSPAAREGLLSEWWLSHGASFEALLTEPEQNRSHNNVCVFGAQNRGLVQPEHATGGLPCSLSSVRYGTR